MATVSAGLQQGTAVLRNKKKTGEISAKMGRWNHRYVIGAIGGPTAKAHALIILDYNLILNVRNWLDEQ